MKARHRQISVGIIFKTNGIQGRCNNCLTRWRGRDQRYETTLIIDLLAEDNPGYVGKVIGGIDSGAVIVKMARSFQSSARDGHILMAIISDSLGIDVINIHAHVRKTPLFGPGVVLPKEHETHVTTEVHGLADIVTLRRRTGVIVATHPTECKAVGKRSG